MNSEIKQCQNCKGNFPIASEDFAFYDQLKVPPPTFCPDCRLQRRIMWRCERSLYKRTCDLCGKGIISVYSTDKAYKVYCRECFHGDGWDPLSYGRDYDFSKPFFVQFAELQREVPRQFAFAFQNVNSDYTNGAAFDKNCYLIFVSDHNEDCQYSYSIFECRTSSDLLNSTECELCYECITCKKCYRVMYSQDCSNSQNLYFCRNLANCHDCVGSANLRNREYCIFNQEYSKDEYHKRLAELNLSSRAGLQSFAPMAQEFWTKFPQKFVHGFQNQGVSGDYIFNSKNCERCFDSDLLEDCKFMNHANTSKSVYDAYVCVDNTEFCMEFVGGLGARNAKYCLWPFTVFDCDYSDNCENSSNLFGSVALHKREYCILNKQYSKDDYFALRTKIIEHMNSMPFVDEQGRVFKYGEFFPPAICPFGYNESVVQEYFPLRKEEALARGYKWKDPEDRGYQITVAPADLPGSIADVPDSITGEIVSCEHAGSCADGCTTAFKITPAELTLYRQLNVPLPHLCFNCRHWHRLRNRNPLALASRKCMCRGKYAEGGQYTNAIPHSHGESPCPNEFQTTYQPERSDIVYCEQCYRQEVS